MADDKETIIFSIQFIRSIILMGFGALLTGIGVPAVKAFIDWRSARRQKILESELARQKEIIDSQIKLLSDFSVLAWKYALEILKVSYAFAYESKELQQKYYDAFGPISWELITQIRSTISAATRLTTPATQQDILKAYEWLIDLDSLLTTMVEKGRAQKDWEKFHETKFDEAGNIIDKAICRLAADLRLNAGNFNRENEIKKQTEGSDIENEKASSNMAV